MNKKVIFNMPQKPTEKPDPQTEKWVTNRRINAPKSETKRFTFDMDKSLHKELKILSVKNGENMKQIVNSFIINGLKNLKTY